MKLPEIFKGTTQSKIPGGEGNRRGQAIHPEVAKTPEVTTYKDRLQLATKQNSMQLLGKLAAGDFSSNTFDFEKRASDLATAKANGTLFTTADTALNDTWNKDRENGSPPEVWAKRVTFFVFRSKKKIENNALLHQLGFQEDITTLSRKEAKQKVRAFLQSDTTTDTYFGTDGAASLTDAVCRDLKGKTDHQEIAKEAERIRTMLDKDKQFLSWIFVQEDARAAFRANVELRIADTLNAFDYHKAIAEDRTNESFYTQPLRPGEPTILKCLRRTQDTTSSGRRPSAPPTNAAQEAPVVSMTPDSVKPADRREDIAAAGELQSPVSSERQNQESAPVEQTEIPARYEVAHAEHFKHHEDSWYANAEKGIVAVYDGVSGEPEGEVASRIAKEATETGFAGSQLNTLNDIGNAMRSVWTKAAEEMRKADEKRRAEELQKPVAMQDTDKRDKHMGTTCTVVKVHTDEDNKRYAVILHAGDSRVYFRKKDGSIRQMTRDDNIWNVSAIRMLQYRPGEKAEEKDKEARETDEIFDNANSEYDLPEDLRERWNARNIVSRVLDAENKDDYTLMTVPLADDDQDIFVTSDGVHDNLKKQEIEEISKNTSNLTDFTSALVEMARKRLSWNEIKFDEAAGRRKSDDITAVGLRFTPTS